MLIGKNYGMIMKTNFFIIIIFLLSFFNTKADLNELDKNYIPLKDFIFLKYDLFIQKNLVSVIKGGGIIGIAYQNINYELKFKKNNSLIITFNAVMNKKRYKSKKYFPKTKDCNQIRNKIFTNKYGYSLFSQKTNNLVDKDLISNSITNNILNITNLEDDLKKEIVEKTEIKINILHPDAQHNLICYGKITDLELKINM